MRKGTYILFMTLKDPMNIEVGSLGMLRVEAGEYCYTGSAMNGMDARISRHFSKEKKIHWHIDRLTMAADGMEAYVSDISECTLAAMASDSGCIPAFKGFGCSDCKCHTHLFLTDGISKQKLLEISRSARFSL